MELLALEKNFTICKVEDLSEVNHDGEFLFIGKTDEELSVVCETEKKPVNTTHCDNGWKGFRIQGVLDFSLVGIMAKISTILAETKIGLFVISTYNTDYVLVKEENFENALDVLAKKGYKIVKEAYSNKRE